MRRSHELKWRWATALVAIAGAHARGQAPPCGSWSPEFEATELPGGLFGYAPLITFDDGTGARLVSVTNPTYFPGPWSVATWDGERWRRLGEYSGTARAFASRHEPGGPRLYAAPGSFGAGGTATAACWDGSAWTNLGGPVNGVVDALAFYDDGNGESLFACGQFTRIDSDIIYGIARWDGAGWSDVGGGLPTQVTFASGWGKAMAAYDDGSGPALYVGGQFTRAGSVTVSSIARWNGREWSNVGGGVGGLQSATAVSTMAVYDDGSGEALYVAGYFTTAGGVSVGHVARWNGAWHDLARGFRGGWVSDGRYVAALAVADLGQGPALYAGGNFRQRASDDLRLHGAARWTGAEWVPLGDGLSMARYIHAVGQISVAPVFDRGAYALAAFDPGDGPRLYAGGPFTEAGMSPATHLASWDGASWARCGEGVDQRVTSLETFDDGRGEALYVGGAFRAVGGIVSRGVARWDGSHWEGLGGGLQGRHNDVGLTVHALKTFDDGNGPALYVAGMLGGAAWKSTGPIVRWDGQSWSDLGASFFTLNGSVVSVADLEAFDDGSGQALYAAGRLGQNSATSEVARYTRFGGWTLIGQTTGGNLQLDCIEAYDDGTGPRLYAGGWFSAINGVPARRLAAWDGHAWSEVGGGVWSPPLHGAVGHLAVFRDELVVSGSFEQAGAQPIPNFVRWNGAAWLPMGHGTPIAPSRLYMLREGATGGGSRLWVAGVFPGSSGEVIAAGSWDGGTWEQFGRFEGGWPLAIKAFGNSVYFGGPMRSAGGATSNNLARWIPCPPCPADCDGDGVLSAADFACFQLRFASAHPYADCNGDGQLTLADFGCFQTKFALGCP